MMDKIFYLSLQLSDAPRNLYSGRNHASIITVLQLLDFFWKIVDITCFSLVKVISAYHKWDVVQIFSESHLEPGNFKLTFFYFMSIGCMGIWGSFPS